MVKYVRNNPCFGDYFGSLLRNTENDCNVTRKSYVQSQKF